VPGGGNGVKNRIHVLDVPVPAAPAHALDMPAIGGVAGGNVLAEGDVGVVLDGNVVLVIEDDQAAQLLMAAPVMNASATGPSAQNSLSAAVLGRTGRRGTAGRGPP